MANQTNNMKHKQESMPEAAEKRSQERNSPAPESAGFDKKLDGPNRPST